jgi:dCTP deaminase
MSVIPFILTGSNRTIVETRQEYDSAGGLESKVIFIQNIDTDQLLSTDSSNVSYDLRVGDEYRDHRDFNKTDISDKDELCLQPGSTVIIETSEFVQFPKSRFGHIVPKVSLLQDGLSNTSSKIDPGYYGKLSITVFNLGKRNIFLKKGQKFCTLYVLDVQDGVIPYEKGPKRIAGNSKVGYLTKIRDFIETNQALLICLSLAVSTVVGIAQIIQIVQVQQQGQKTEKQSSQEVKNLQNLKAR